MLIEDGVQMGSVVCHLFWFKSHFFNWCVEFLKLALFSFCVWSVVLRDGLKSRFVFSVHFWACGCRPTNIVILWSTSTLQRCVDLKQELLCFQNSLLDLQINIHIYIYTLLLYTFTIFVYLEQSKSDFVKFFFQNIFSKIRKKKCMSWLRVYFCS